jgi:hypothetical protein
MEHDDLPDVGQGGHHGDTVELMRPLYGRAHVELMAGAIEHESGRMCCGG